MGRRLLRARFFVAADGTCYKKACQPDLSRKHKVFVRDGGKCRYCGIPLGWTVKRGEVVNGEHHAHTDHLVPRSRGGQNDLANLVLACAPCNMRKGTKIMHPAARRIRRGRE